MLQAWQFYYKENNTTLVPKSEFKLNGWVRDTRKANKQYINNEQSTMNKEWEELLKAVNFPYIHPTNANRSSEKKVKSTLTKKTTKNTWTLTSQKENTVASMATETAALNDDRKYNYYQIKEHNSYH